MMSQCLCQDDVSLLRLQAHQELEHQALLGFQALKARPVPTALWEAQAHPASLVPLGQTEPMEHQVCCAH